MKFLAASLMALTMVAAPALSSAATPNQVMGTKVVNKVNKKTNKPKVVVVTKKPAKVKKPVIKSGTGK